MTFEVPALAAGFASKFDTIGPYLGFASLIAVVAMAVLVFAQGREIQRLREWAGTAPERLAALEARLEEELRRVGRPQTLARHPGTAPPAVPGAPVPPAVPGTPPAAGTPVPRPAVPAGTPVTGASTPAAVAAGTPPGSVPVAPRPTPPGVPDPGQQTRAIPASAATPRAATAAGRSASTARERRAAASPPPRSIPQIVGVAAVLLVVLLGLLFAFGVIGGDGTSPVAETNAKDAKVSEQRRKSPRFSARNTPVVVLNASGQGGLARSISDKLDNLRFPTGEAANFMVNGMTADQAVTSVEYRAGAGNREAAQSIADKVIKLPGAQVKRMTPDAQASASGTPKVIVVVGRDYAAQHAATTPTTTTPESPVTTGQ